MSDERLKDEHLADIIAKESAWKAVGAGDGIVLLMAKELRAARDENARLREEAIFSPPIDANTPALVQMYAGKPLVLVVESLLAEVVGLYAHIRTLQERLGGIW